MMRALSTAGTGMVAQQTNMDVIANNLANVNTTAFKSQRAEFQDLMYQTFRASGATSGGDTRLPESAQIGLGAKFAASATSFANGSLTTSPNATDMAINGEGFFQVELPSGELGYTRDGTFKIDATGTFVTADGYKLKPNLVLQPGYRALTISPSGEVACVLPGNDDPTTVGNITICTFSNPAGLTRVGQNIYMAGGGSGSPTELTPGKEGSGSLQQYAYEGSNVQVVEEMVRMITAQRAYEINSKAIQSADDMLGILNNLKR
ncbi:MAG: flagellar basal-body rod protein FlgG [Fimbriimonadaceae bacterium]|nr:flagellar basal-body rod protein FlgG [Fimbriimonadaceae bacterium]